MEDEKIVYVNSVALLQQVFVDFFLEIKEGFEGLQTTTDFFRCYLDENSFSEFASLLEAIALKLVENYEEGKAIVQASVASIDKNMEKSKIMNTHLLFVLLKE